VQPSRFLGFRWLAVGGLCGLLVGSWLWLASAAREAKAAGFWPHRQAKTTADCVEDDHPGGFELGGTWYWLHSPEEEKRITAALFNRYCIRCHGVDGRGVWDIPDVPDFTNVRWQACRSDGQLARLILEGRGAVMPPFRGTLSLEEAWAMARYLRSFVPGTEASRPDFGPKQKPAAVPDMPAPKKLDVPK
jgi:hypothetical protein